MAVQSLRELLSNRCSPTLLSNTIYTPSLSQVGSAILVSAPARTSTFLPQVTKQTLQILGLSWPITVFWQLRTAICHGFHPGRSFLSSGFIEQPHRDPEQSSHSWAWLGVSLSFASECHPCSGGKALIFWGCGVIWGIPTKFIFVARVRSTMDSPRATRCKLGSPRRGHRLSLFALLPRWRSGHADPDFLFVRSFVLCAKSVWSGQDSTTDTRRKTISCHFFGRGGWAHFKTLGTVSQALTLKNMDAYWWTHLASSHCCEYFTNLTSQADLFFDVCLPLTWRNCIIYGFATWHLPIRTLSKHKAIQ